MAKSTIVVVPPHAAARVPVSNVSAATVPPNGISMWVWPSTPPGMTYLPVASITVSAVQPWPVPRATTFSSSIEHVDRELVGRGDDEPARDERSHRGDLLDRGDERGQAFLGLRARQRKGWGDAQHVAVQAALADEHAAPLRAPPAPALAMSGAGSVRPSDELHADHQTLAAHVADMRAVDRAQPLEQDRPLPRGVLLQAVVEQVAQVGQRSRRRSAASRRTSRSSWRRANP